MSPLWALCVVLLVVIVLFVVLPSFSNKKPNQTHKISPASASASAAPGTTTKMSRGSPEHDQEAERCLDREMMKSIYPPPLTADTPVDYPKKAIGACPDSKPQKKALPLADMPMFLASDPKGI